MVRELGRIRVRILAVMLIVVVVPVAGLELARVVEHQLLGSLERDMRDQAIVVARALEGAAASRRLPREDWVRPLTRAGRATRTRVRVLEPSGVISVDSHVGMPTSGAADSSRYTGYGLSTRPFGRGRGPLSLFGERSTGTSYSTESWPPLVDRREVREAFTGSPSSATRVHPVGTEVRLFVTEPVRGPDGVEAVVYVDRSTQPVLLELYRVRGGLLKILLLSVGLAALLTLVLSWSISRPMAKLARAARGIAEEPPGVAPGEVPLVGTGEIRDLALALRAMARRLVERATSVRNFAADVAHEFKSPLTSIRGAAELLLDGADEDPPARERFLRNIREDSERLDRLVTRLLELSRLESSTSEMSIVDLEEVSRGVADRFSTVAVDMSASKRFVRGRRGDLELALRNAVDNAVRFSQEDEQVTITLRNHDGLIELAVTDRGPGIAPDHLPQVFDRFFTTDMDRRGTGLGLAIVRTVLRAHGGAVEAVSPVSEGRGTTVVMRLPVL